MNEVEVIDDPEGIDEDNVLQTLFDAVRGQCEIGEDISYELNHQTLRAETFARELANAVESTLTLENMRKRRKATLWKYEKTKELKEGEKRLSEKDIEYMVVELDEEYAAIKDQIPVATAALEYMRSMTKAIDGRNTMLVNLKKLTDHEVSTQVRGSGK